MMHMYYIRLLWATLKNETSFNHTDFFVFVDFIVWTKIYDKEQRYFTIQRRDRN